MIQAPSPPVPFFLSLWRGGGAGWVLSWASPHPRFTLVLTAQLPSTTPASPVLTFPFPCPPLPMVWPGAQGSAHSDPTWPPRPHSACHRSGLCCPDSFRSLCLRWGGGVVCGILVLPDLPPLWFYLNLKARVFSEVCSDLMDFVDAPSCLPCPVRPRPGPAGPS